jgi:primosomal replication protein N''
VRFVLGKTTPRVDLAELGTASRPAEAILNHIISRTDVPIRLDPEIFVGNDLLEGRLRRLASHASMFRRDTGIDGRYLGFPFLLLRDSRLVSPSAKPRIAPVLLWPVVLDVQAGAGGSRLTFDREREEIRLNPALEGLLGTQDFAKWREAHQEVLERPIIRVGDVVDIFGGLANPRGRALTTIPGNDVRIAPQARELVACAALFNAEFTGQAVSEDLRKMRNVSPVSTALEVVLRVSPEPPAAPPLPPVREVERFLTVESDPSQETAILRARLSPGLLIEGPPGTGKSQTIVNMVADAVGRNETVLIVCQKQPALKVVQKRLEAEGLGERLFTVVDVNRDREGIVRVLRDQVPQVRSQPPDRVSPLRTKRQSLAVRIETLEAEVDRHHEALHALDALAGSSYRALLGELVGVESNGKIIEVPALRLRFSEVERSEISRIEEICSPLAELWLNSDYESNPLRVLRYFSVDEAVRHALLLDLSGLVSAEAKRQQILANTSPSFEINDPAPYRAWLDRYGPLFENMAELIRHGLAVWFNLFKPEHEQVSIGEGILKLLKQTKQALFELNDRAHDPRSFERITGLTDQELVQWLRVATRASGGSKSFLGRMLRWLPRRRMRRFLRNLGHEPTDERMGAIKEALALERVLRPLRKSVAEAKKKLRMRSGSPVALAGLRKEVNSLIEVLQLVQAAVIAALECPRPTEAERMACSNPPESFPELRRNFEDAIKRHAARQASVAALRRLAQWTEPQWIAGCETCIAQGVSNGETLKRILSAMKTLEPYQRFRVRAKDLDPEVLAVFSVLREREDELRATPAERLEVQVRSIIHREALLAWKSRIERDKPALLVERREILEKIKTLADLDKELRELNRKLLATNIHASRLGSQTEWDDITRLRGPRMKRLREIMDLGADLGLMTLRPIWLMNPDVASRILPRKPCLFDLVVYDEASQMLVEHAIPTLFRASRVVISGDEKQMPPSRFFVTQIDSAEDEELDGDILDEAITESERAVREESWDRREVKDCPDLLQLGRSVLPRTTLQVHYRSKYRELINYSNAAFYQGTLSVPPRHPDDEIRRVKPIEVIRVDGIYEGQTNKSEASKVVEVLAGIWSAPPGRRPTVGVVTFNRKQADQVEEAIEKRAKDDSEFLRAYECERERTENGEDMGFFVQNVENVQGHERDIIVFSTTFGRDKHGSFRRNFGALGQPGGERRLNVAITRAREKVILLTSMPVRDISDLLATGRAPSRPRDFLQAYLDYALKIATGELDMARAASERLGPQHRSRSRSGYEDGFSASVRSFIRELGHVPVQANDGDAFGLDFAIRNSRTGLFGIGIECDAPRHELLHHARAREIWRPAVLSRAIPKVHRVDSHAWYHRPVEERKRLRIELENALS